MDLQFEKSKKLVLLAVVLFLFLQAFLWTEQSEYNLGGDDSRLYSYAPAEYAKNTALYSWYGTAVGSNNPQQFLLPFLGLGTAIQWVFPFVNLQKALYGLIFSLSFLGSYLLIQEILPLDKNNKISFFSSVAGGFSYVFFPLALWFWKHPLNREITGLALYPFLLFFFFKALNTKKPRYLIFGSALGVLFAPATFLSPNFYALLIGILTFLCIYFVLFKENRLLLIKYAILYSAIFLIFNSFWLIPSLLASLTYIGQISNTATASGIVNFVAPDISIYFTLAGLPSPLIENNTYLQLLARLDILLPLILVIPVFIKPSNSSDYRAKKTWLSLVIPTIVLAYFQTVNIGNVGIALFQWLTSTIPGWVMFKSFYRVFPQAYALFFSLTLAISLYALLRTSPFRVEIFSGNTRVGSIRSLNKVLATFMLIIIILSGIPLITGYVINQPIGNDDTLTRNVQIPQYYIDAIAYVNGLEDGRVLSLPLLKGNWAYFSSESGNGVYVGISPIRLLTGRYEIAGTIDLESSPIATLGSVVEKAIINKNYFPLKNFLALLSVRYLMYNSEAFSVLTPQRVGGVDAVWGNQQFQTDESIRNMLHELSANEIKTFGPINIYEVPSQNTYPSLYAAQNLTYFNGDESSLLNLPIHNSVSTVFYLGTNESLSPNMVTNFWNYIPYEGNQYYNVNLPKTGIYTLYKDTGERTSTFKNRFIEISTNFFDAGSHTIRLPVSSPIIENFTTLSSQWKDLRGAWKIENGSFTPSTWTYNWAESIYDELFYSVQIKSQIKPNDNFMYLLFNFQNDDNYYEFGITPYKPQGSENDLIVDLVKLENGQRLVLGAEAIAITPDGLYNLELSFNEGNIKGFVNEIKVIDIFDANFTTHGAVGVQATGNASLTLFEIYPSPPPGYLLSSQIEPNVQHENPVLNYMRISPVEYKATVSNATSPFCLVLSDTYDSGWVVQFDESNEATRSKTPEPYHFKANGYANAWYINKTGSYTITIEYEPQTWFFYGSVISVTTLTVCAAYLTYGFAKNKGLPSKIKQKLTRPKPQ
jgi:hypothetical protein